MEITVPGLWGQGQLFAFSALDGESLYSDDFVGILSGDRLGVRFFSKKPRELAFAAYLPIKPQVETVTGDLIVAQLPGKRVLQMVYAQARLIVGSVCQPAEMTVLVDGSCSIIQDGDVQVQDTGDGEYSALLQKDGRFAFGFGHNAREAVALVHRGIAMDIDQQVQKKLDFYRNVSVAVATQYRPLAAKCLSVMKTQLYSPQGRFCGIWSTPDRLPHRKLWLWDSVFHAIGWRHVDPKVAQSLILTMLQTQQEDGFIPHMSTPETNSDITQPPVIAWGAWKVYEISRDKTFLRQVYEKNRAFLRWCRDNRRQTERELYTWFTNDSTHCRCDESGMDNSPRFDTAEKLFAIDFSCFMANETRMMAAIAGELGDDTARAEYNAWFLAIREAVNGLLWCPEDGFYYDYSIPGGKWHKVESVASFLPLFAGLCDRAQADCLVAALKDPNRFGSTLPVPSIAKRDATFGTDMWRGPVWINYNYMIAEGLNNCGYGALATQLRRKTLQAVDKYYRQRGTVYEFYDSEDQKAPPALNRKGVPFEPYDFRVRIQTIRDYGWTAALTLDLLCGQEGV